MKQTFYWMRALKMETTKFKNCLQEAEADIETFEGQSLNVRRSVTHVTYIALDHLYIHIHI